MPPGHDALPTRRFIGHDEGAAAHDRLGQLGERLEPPGLVQLDLVLVRNRLALTVQQVLKECRSPPRWCFTLSWCFTLYLRPPHRRRKPTSKNA